MLISKIMVSRPKLYVTSRNPLLKYYRGRYDLERLIHSEDYGTNDEESTSQGLLSYIKKFIGHFKSSFLTPKWSNKKFNLDSLLKYISGISETKFEAVIPLVISERIEVSNNKYGIVIPTQRHDIQHTLDELSEMEIGNYNLKKVIGTFLKIRETQLNLPMIDEKGGVAILVSYALNPDEVESKKYSRETIGKFYFEMFKRLQYFDGVELGKKPVLRLEATTDDLHEVLDNPYFSSIIVIGHGRYGVWSATDKAIDWAHVADYMVESKNLKSGFWMQLTCTPTVDEPISLMVPFSYFAMKDPYSILSLEDRGREGEYNNKDFMGVTSDQESTHIQPVRFERQVNNSFLPKLEEYQKMQRELASIKRGNSIATHLGNNTLENVMRDIRLYENHATRVGFR